LSQEGLDAGQYYHGKLNLIEYVIEDLHPNDLGMLALPPRNAASEMRFRGSVDAGRLNETLVSLPFTVIKDVVAEPVHTVLNGVLILGLLIRCACTFHVGMQLQPICALHQSTSTLLAPIKNKIETGRFNCLLLEQYQYHKSQGTSAFSFTTINLAI